jgi:hypothetical protein
VLANNYFRASLLQVEVAAGVRQHYGSPLLSFPARFVKGVSQQLQKNDFDFDLDLIATS